VTEQGHGEGEAERAVLASLRLAIVFSAVTLLLEGAGAFLSRSLSVTVDAIHNIPDLIAFAISLQVLRSTERGAHDRFTFGAHRLEVFAGMLNAALVLGTGAAFAYEALDAIATRTPFAGPVDALWVLLIALPTLGLRTANVASLRRVPGRARDLNLRGVIVHVASDLAITGALLAMGVLLLLRPGATLADPVAALAIAGVLVYESLPLFRDGWEVLTESTPRHLSIDAIVGAARAVPNVAEVHDVHVWAVCPTMVCMTAHIEVNEMSVREGMAVVAALRRRMEEQFGILHATFEVEARAG
jgi:cobalt-zinc-cadmium efflux system protein